MGTFGSEDSFINLLQEKVDSPQECSKVLTTALQNRGADVSKFNVSHLYVLHFPLQLYTFNATVLLVTVDFDNLLFLILPLKFGSTMKKLSLFKRRLNKVIN